VIAIVSGLIAALAFAASLLAATFAARRIGAGSTVALVMLLGFPIALLAALSDTTGLGGASYGWLAIAGIGNVVGLGLEYAALRVGRVGVVAPLASTEGGVAALLSIAAGAPFTWPLVLALGIVATGGALTAASAEPAGHEASQTDLAVLSVALALLAAISFGSSLYATGRVSQSLPLGWVLLPARLFGVLLVTVPLAATGRLKLERSVAPAVVVTGLAEVVGFLCIGIGTRTDIAITSVLASQFAAFAAIGAVVLFGERLSAIQKGGIATIAVGTALVAIFAA
jgi:drug/metabolite transporter (DMT)-like permease